MPDQPQQSGFLGTLKSKFGPLPVWGWLALITVVLLGYWLYQQHKAGSQQQQTSPITGQPGVVVINQGDTDQTTGPAPKKKGKGKGTGDDDDGKHKRHRHHHHKPQGAMTPPATAESKNGTPLPATAASSTGQLRMLPQPFPTPAPTGDSSVDLTGIEETG